MIKPNDKSTEKKEHAKAEETKEKVREDARKRHEEGKKDQYPPDPLLGVKEKDAEKLKEKDDDRFFHGGRSKSGATTN